MSETTVTLVNMFCHGHLMFEVEPGKVTLITGKNSTGKTGIATTLAALASGEANPLKLASHSVKAYIQDEKKTGEASLTYSKYGNEPVVTWSPPNMTINRYIEMEQPHTVGLIDFVSPKNGNDRAQMWLDFFLPQDPTTVLTGLKVQENYKKRLVDMILDKGWNMTLQIMDDLRLAQKRLWQDLTGKPRWGMKAAQTWLPEGWLPELETANREKLAEEVVEVRRILEEYTIQDAVEQSAIDDAVSLREENEGKITSALSEAEEDLASLLEQKRVRQVEAEEIKSSKVRAEQLKQDEMTFINQTAPLFCPHCTKGIVLRDNFLEEWEAPTPEREREAQDKILAIEQESEELEKLFNLAAATYKNIVQRIADRRDEIGRLKGQLSQLLADTNLAEKKARPAIGSESVRSDMIQQVQDAEARLRAFDTYHKARTINESITDYDVICSALGPTGIRTQMMEARMRGIKRILKNLDEISGWAPTTILPDYSIHVSGRPVQLCAENERWKAQALMQIACALLLKSRWLVLDAADRLKDESWEGLVEILSRLAIKRDDMHIVLCATSVQRPPSWNLIRL